LPRPETTLVGSAAMRRALSLLLLLAAFGVAVAGCGGGEETTPTPNTVEGTLSTEAEVTGNAEAGKAVFASAGCGGCHTLQDANATGNVGPNLDDAKPSEELVTDRVTNGKGVMPSFKGQLTDQQIADVAAYVSSVAGQS